MSTIATSRIKIWRYFAVLILSWGSGLAPGLEVGVLSQESRTLVSECGLDSMPLPHDQRVSGEGLALVYVSQQDLASLSSAESKDLVSLYENGVCFVFEGSEASAASLFGIAIKDDTLDEPPQFFAVKQMADGNVKRGYFFVSTKSSEHYSIDMETGTKTLLEQRGVVHSHELGLDKQLPSLLEEALVWGGRSFEVGPPASREGIDLVRKGLGAWNAIDSSDFTFTGADAGKTEVRVTLTVNEFKIQDSYSSKDWYLAESRVHHELPIDTPYRENFPLIPLTTGYVGWYVQDRELKTRRTDSSTLAEYGPTGTILSSSTTIGIGGAITTDPSAGITASYSKTYSKSDIIITDHGSLSSGYGDWNEEFTCPRGDYFLYPLNDWPCRNSKSSYYSYQAAIFRTTDLNSGVSVTVTPGVSIYLDEMYCYLPGAFNLTRWLYDLGSPQTLRLFKNYPPDRPAEPSGSSDCWVNSTYSFSTDGSDHDGDSLSYMFGWGDSQSSYGSSSQSHKWTDGGQKGVRARSKDSPHGAESNWSPTFPVFVKAMTRIDISGTDHVDENSSGASYSCRATYNNNDTSSVSPSWSIQSGSAYASINSSGWLTPKDLDRDQNVVIKASYTDHGVTKTDTKTVTIDYVPTLYTITGSAGANGSISPSGTFEKTEGEDQPFTAIPNHDYAVDRWSLDGRVVQTAGTSYTLRNIQSDHRVDVTFSEDTGSLQVTIEPSAARSAGAQWRVDSGSWHNSGYMQSGLSVGQHTVSFKDISGWTKPGNTSVTIYKDQTTSTIGLYGEDTGSLKVTIEPSGARSAGAKWRVDSGSWHSSGHTQSGLSVGQHTVSFKDIGGGWTKPGDKNVTIYKNQTTTESGTYTQDKGSLKVTIEPSDARSAGAQWRVDSGSWHSSGHTQSGLSVGQHTVSFKDISGGWTKPGDKTVTIYKDQTTSTSGTYIYSPDTGSLKVTIEPSGARSAGAQWRVDGGSWHNSGYTQSDLSVGEHTVSFKDISGGWTEPGNKSVTIYKDQTTTKSGTYIYIGTPPPPPDNVRATSGTHSAFVHVWWDDVVGSDLRYRVYRDGSPASDWLAETQFDDTDADAPDVSIDCLGKRHVHYNEHCYQVRAKNTCGESNLSPCATGYRGATKSLDPDKTIYEKALPLADAESQAELAVRLMSDEQIELDSVWALLEGDGWSEEGGVWRATVAGDDRDGWVVFAPSEALVAGETVTLTAGAVTVSGVELEPVTAVFEVASGLDKTRGYSPLSFIAADESDAVAPLAEAAGGSVYRIGPAGVFDVPAPVWIPVPAGADVDALEVCYFSEAEEHRGWYRAGNVIGWMVPGSRRTVVEDGQTYIEIEVNHSGVVQLASPVAAPKPNGADIGLLLGVALVLSLAGSKRAHAMYEKLRG